MAKKKMRTAKTISRRRWSKEDNRELKAHSKGRTPVAKVARAMKRSVGALRQQAMKLGLGLGHQR
jgi:transposase-like protein